MKLSADKVAKSKPEKLAPLEIKDSKTFRIVWPLLVNDKGQYLTNKFSICDGIWILSFSFTQLDEVEYLSVHLLNETEEETAVKYFFTIKSVSSKLTWSDPDGFIHFSKCSDKNNEWGNDELIELSLLEEKFVEDGHFSFEIELIKKTQNSSLANRSLHEEIEQISDQNGLIELANEDLGPLIKKLPVCRNINEQKKQEDRIVSSLR
jgi:hypothetical protein